MFQTFFLQFEFEEDNKNEHLKLFVEEKKLFVLLQLKTILIWKTPFIICSCVKKTHHIENVLIKNF